MPDTPDQVIARDNFSAYKTANYPNMSDGDAFERFAISQISLRHLNLGASEVESGIVGAANDGGIDGLYIFLNGQELIRSDSIRLSRRKDALEGLQFGVSIDVTIVQAKLDTSWDSNVFPKIESALKVILDSGVTSQKLRDFPLNDDIVEKALLLRKLREKLSMRVPLLRFVVQYVTLAAEGNLENYLETKRSQLQDWLLTKLPSGSSAEVQYIADAQVVTQLRTNNDFVAKLIFIKPPVRVGTAMVGLVKIEDYLHFLRKDGSTVIREELFAVNVRDYAGGGIGVNNAIAQTLANDSATEFWWLNNGVTIIADHAADPIELEWVVTNPLIVNGLQTSNVIQAQSLADAITAPRLGQTILIRLITESNPDVREAIIAGTNNQTAIASIQLHANEEKQLRIEEYLRSSDWYYERRRYQYRGTSTPPARIRTVTDVAQAVMAFRLLEPDTARARPGSLLNKAAGWQRVFNPIEPEELFLRAVNVAHLVDTYLATPKAKKIADDATNARHYLISGYALRSSGVKNLADFAKVPSPQLKGNPSQAMLAVLHKLLYAIVTDLDDGKTPRDQLFKGSKLKPLFFNGILKLNSK